MCEDEYEYPTIRDLIKRYTEMWMDRVRIYFRKKYCDIVGHKFKLNREVNLPLIKDEKFKDVIVESCRCGEFRFIFKITGELLTDEELRQWHGFMIYDLMHAETKIWDILPKKEWNSEE